VRGRNRTLISSTSSLSPIATAEASLPGWLRIMSLERSMLHPVIETHLTADDDPGLWEVVTNTILAGAVASARRARQDVYVQIGCCRHWISPHHPLHWVVGGGRFTWPFGYDRTTSWFSYRASPELSWSETLKWTGEAWESRDLAARSLILRIAIPARTARHLRASIHTIWTPHSPTSKEKVIQIYAFRNGKEAWSEAARRIVTPQTRQGLTTSRIVRLRS
jgi:hypothetical protein